MAYAERTSVPAMQNEQMLRLAERLEKATGPDRALDCYIAAAIQNGALCPDITEKDVEFLCAVHEDRDGRDCLFEFTQADENRVPRYTASIDAAMSLKPEGWRHAIWYPDGGIKVQVWNPQRSYAGFGVDIPEATAVTYALALCAAALRSRTGDQSNG